MGVGRNVRRDDEPRKWMRADGASCSSFAGQCRGKVFDVDPQAAGVV